jgi:hypothetical protein
MTLRRAAAIALPSLALTWLLVTLWFRSRCSEATWTWLNGRLSAGTDPGLASDLELVLAVLIGLGVSVATVALAARLLRKRQEQR